MPRSRRTACIALSLFATALLSTPVGNAQEWPTKPVRIVVAGPAGGTADITARLLADGLEKENGKPVIVEPKPGAAGAIAVNTLIAAPRDGHTVLVGVNSLVTEIPVTAGGIEGLIDHYRAESQLANFHPSPLVQR